MRTFTYFCRTFLLAISCSWILLPTFNYGQDNLRDATIQNRQLIEETLRRVDRLDEVQLDKRVSVVETKLNNIEKEITSISGLIEKFQWGIICLLVEACVRVYGQFRSKKNDE